MKMNSVGDAPYTLGLSQNPVVEHHASAAADPPPDEVAGTEPEPATAVVQQSCLDVMADKLNSMAPNFGTASATRNAGVGAAIGSVLAGTATGLSLALASHWPLNVAAVTTVLGAMGGGIFGAMAGCAYRGDSQAPVPNAQP